MTNALLQPGSLGDHTALIQSAIDTASRAGGGKIVFTPGLYRTGTVHLRSNVHLHLEMGAVWKGSDRLEDFEHVQSPVLSRMDKQPWAAFLSGIEVENVVIDGEGTIDGNGGAPVFQTGKGDDPRRPYGLFFVASRNITVRGLTLRNSAFWMQRYLACKGVRLDDLNVHNHANLNNDGIDIDSSEDVAITGCALDVSDDAICLKSESGLPCRNIVIANCRMATHASGFKMGTGSLTGFENITLSNCIFHPSRSKVIVHTLGFREGISAIDLASVDGAFLRCVTISNCVIEGFANLFNIRLGNRHSRSILTNTHADEAADGRPLCASGEGLPPAVKGSVEQICISGITAHGVGPIAAAIVGYEGNPVRGVTLSDIDVRCGNAGCEADLTQTPDWDPKRYPVAIMYTPNVEGIWPPPRWHGLPAYGLVIRDAEGVTLRNVRFQPAPCEPRPCYFVENAAEVTLDGVPLP